MVHGSMAELGQNSIVSGPKRLHYAFLLECLSFRCSRKLSFSSCVRWCMHAQLCLTLQPHGLQPTRLLCSWDSPGKNTGAGCHFLPQGILPTSGSNLSLLYCRREPLQHCTTREPLAFRQFLDPKHPPAGSDQLSQFQELVSVSFLLEQNHSLISTLR